MSGDEDYRPEDRARDFAEQLAIGQAEMTELRAARRAASGAHGPSGTPALTAVHPAELEDAIDVLSDDGALAEVLAAWRCGDLDPGTPHEHDVDHDDALDLLLADRARGRRIVGRRVA